MNQNVLKSLRENWVLVAFCVGIIITWTNFLSADKLAEDRLTKVEALTTSQTISQSQIQTQLSQIQTDLSWIKIKLK